MGRAPSLAGLQMSVVFLPPSLGAAHIGFRLFFVPTRGKKQTLERQFGREQVGTVSPWLACLCSLQAAKCTQCFGQDRENGVWKRAAFLIFGYLEQAVRPRVPHRQPSSHGDGFALTLLGVFDLIENHVFCSSVIWMIVFKFSYTLNDLA